MVSIYGRNFPAQIGMMVDGIPLTQSIGVAQPLIRDDSTAFAEASAELKDGKVLEGSNASTLIRLLLCSKGQEAEMERSLS